MDELKQLRNQLYYDELPEWKKFIHGWSVAIRNGGMAAIIKYPIIWYKLWNKVHNK